MASTRHSPTRPSTAPASAGRDRWLVAAGLAAALLCCWGYLLYMAWGMARMDIGAEMLVMPRMTGWRAADLLLVFLMWTLMMAAMMLPSAVPMIWLFARIKRARTHGARACSATGVFVCGYLVVWTGFSLLATLAQWALLETRVVSPMMESASPLLSAALLVAAGAYQFTPLKHACLAKCRSPLGFLLTEWRDRLSGAFAMGVRHGAFCTGCCWLLMLLPLVVGVMSLLWAVVLAALVWSEKVLPRSRLLTRGTGFALLAWGAVAGGRGMLAL